MFSRDRKSVRKRTNHGFALVVALSLMAFILLLLLSLSAIVRVESQSSEISIKQLEARQNAFLGVMVAAGQLQKYMGPDQRVSATADILDEDYPKWTGVWRESNPTNNDNPHVPVDRPLLLTWLVSGNESVALPPETSTTELTLDLDPNGFPVSETLQTTNNTPHVWLLNEAAKFDHDNNPSTPPVLDDPSNLGVRRKDLVQLPIEPIRNDGNNNVDGYFAWWVSDEGVKAAVDIVDPYASAYNDSSDPNSLLAPQSSGLDALQTIRSSSDFAVNYDKLENLQRVEDLSFIASDLASISGRHFHDLNAGTFGLITDARKGGLRKDLSVALTSNSALSGLINDHPSGRSIFPPAFSANPTADDPGGPYWDQLADYYGIGSDLGLSSATSEINLDANEQRLFQSDTQMGIYPVMAGFQLAHYVTMVKPDPSIAISPNARRLRYWFMPRITLWNPYSYDMVIPDLYVRMGTDVRRDQNNLRISYRAYEGGPTTRNNRIAQRSSGSGNMRAYTTLGDGSVGDANEPTPLTFTLEGTTIPAGEALLFAPGAHGALVGSNEFNARDNLLTADPGRSNMDFGFWFDYTRFPESELQFEYDPSKTYHVRMIKGNYSDKHPNKLNRMTLWVSRDPDFDQEQVSVYANVRTGLAMGDLFNPYYGQGPLSGWKNLRGSRRHELKDRDPTDPLNAGPFTTDLYDGYPRFANSYTMNFSDKGHDRLFSSKLKLGNIPWLATANPRAHLFGRSPLEELEVDEQGYQNPYGIYGGGSDGYNTRPGKMWNLEVYGSNDQPYVGHSYHGDVERSVLFDLPLDNAVFSSIGQFAHVHFSRDSGFDTNQSSQDEDRYQVGDRYLYSNYRPAYPVGNSRADFRIPFDSTYVSWSNVWGSLTKNSPVLDETDLAPTGVHYDYSYLLNAELWDSYFLSTVSSNGGIIDPLPNSRMIPFYRDGVKPLESSRRDLDRSAAVHVIKGAFNVNSTSVEAWASLLSSFLGVDVRYLDNGALAIKQTEDNEVPYPRLSVSADDQFEDDTNPNLAEDLAYSGFRALDSSLIWDDNGTPHDYTDDSGLAHEIVSSLRGRRGNAAKYGGVGGPFTSLGEFINRSLDDSLDQSLKSEGLLAQSLRTSSVNQTFFDDATDVLDDSSLRVQIPDNEGYELDALKGMGVLEHVPAYLSQADLLSRVGSVLSARSDTFKVRAYGSSVNPMTGQPENDAWCEAVFQRIPDFVDANADSAETALRDLNSPVNEFFGRRFVLLSFRWLAPDEV